MTVRLRPIALALTVALATVAVPAQADEYDAAFTRAIAAKERALDTNDPASWQAAVDLFVEADRIRATKESKYELGAAASRLKQDDLAVEAFEVALSLGLEGPAADKARAFVAEHGKAMGRVEARGPAGSDLWVAGRWRGSLPLPKPLVVFPGKRRFELRAAGDRTEREVGVAAGTTVVVDFTTERAGTPALADPPPVDRPRAVPPERDDTWAWTLSIGGAGVTVISALTMGLSFGNLASHRERLADVCATPSGVDACAAAKPGKKEAAQSEVDSIATWKAVRTGSYVGVGVGVAAAGAGLVMLLSRPKSKSARQTAIGAWPTPGGAQLGVFGSLN
ncbi:MAG: hypothetical protein HYZ29_34155 [Myxococcales bacterium]|nr:hypothetical protein [Myxococcales bacterium]